MDLKVIDAVCETLYADLKQIASSTPLNRESHKSFLITGGSGFIAYYIVMSLLLLNDQKDASNSITIMVRSEKKAIAKYGALLERSDFHVMVQDVCTPMSEDTAAYDYIIHAASGASAQQFDADPIGVFNSNVIGMENMINFVRRKPCKSMVYVSSFTVYGAGTDSVPAVTEDFRGSDDWTSKSACYSFGKKSAELLCVSAVRKYQCPIRIVRPGFVYGGSDPLDSRVYAEIIRNVAEKNNICMQSAGLLYRSMIYVTDVVRGIFVALLCGQDGEAYNIANEFVSIRGFAEAAVEAAGSEKVVLTFRNDTDAGVPIPATPDGAMSADKLRSCGWEPAVALIDGIKMAAGIYTAAYLK